jgi:hypothetical protein
MSNGTTVHEQAMAERALCRALNGMEYEAREAAREEIRAFAASRTRSAATGAVLLWCVYAVSRGPMPLQAAWALRSSVEDPLPPSLLGDVRPMLRLFGREARFGAGRLVRWLRLLAASALLRALGFHRRSCTARRDDSSRRAPVVPGGMGTDGRSREGSRGDAPSSDGRDWVPFPCMESSGDAGAAQAPAGDAW